MRKYILLFCLFAFVCSFNIIQRIAKFRDEHLKLLLQKEEANENAEKLIKNEVSSNITNQSPKKPAIPVKPKAAYRGRYNKRRYRRPKRDL